MAAVFAVGSRVVTPRGAGTVVESQYDPAVIVQVRLDRGSLIAYHVERCRPEAGSV